MSDAQRAPAEAIVRAAIDQGLRAEVAADGSLGSRIRRHRLVPYQAIIGPAEAASGDASLRLRAGRKLPPMAAGEALGRISAHVTARSPGLWEPELAPAAESRPG